MIDLKPETNLDQLAGIAIDLAEKVRRDDPVVVQRHVQSLCQLHPAKAAQIVMVLAVWLDPETPVNELWRRAEAAAAESQAARRRVRRVL